MTIAELIARIDAYCEAHKLPPTAFGRLAVGDPSFVPRLRKPGGDCRLSTANRLLAFMAGPPPVDGAAAPAGAPSGDAVGHGGSADARGAA